MRTVATLHKIGYALETINHKDYMTWNLELHHVGPSGPFGLIDKKKYVPGDVYTSSVQFHRRNSKLISSISFIQTDHKKIQKATPNLMKKNWHEVLESMAELLGAFERDEKYGNLTSMKVIDEVANQSHYELTAEFIFCPSTEKSRKMESSYGESNLTDESSEETSGRDRESGTPFC